MKKPKITEGEWHVNTTAFGDTPIVTTKENGWVADIPQSDGMELANAKAISAVPEMIDALIELRREYKELADSGDCGFWEAETCEEYNKATEALKKAGVEL